MSKTKNKIPSGDEICAFIGKSVQRHRERRGLTQRAMAKAMGLEDHSGLVRLENGKENITMQRLCDVAEALNVPVHTLLMPDDHEDKTPCENRMHPLAIFRQNGQDAEIAEAEVRIKLVPKTSTEDK